ncbi:MAG TPA: hypothetical protein VGK54_03940, partial [Chloroflexota bacterium]
MDTVSVDKALARAARLVAETEDPDQALQALLDLIVESAGATKGSLMRTEGEGLEPVAVSGRDGANEGRPSPQPSIAVGRPEPPEPPGAGGGSSEPSGAGHRGSIPLVVGGRVEGALLLQGEHGE